MLVCEAVQIVNSRPIAARACEDATMGIPIMPLDLQLGLDSGGATNKIRRGTIVEKKAAIRGKSQREVLGRMEKTSVPRLTP